MSNFQKLKHFGFDGFEQNEDSSGKVYLLSEQPSPLISSTVDFNVEGFKLSIIDQFGGRLPYLSNNLDYANCGRNSQKKNALLIPTIMFDSHIVAYIHQYRMNIDEYKKNPRKDRNNIDQPRNKCINKLLKFVIEKGFDPNPTFSFVEALAKPGNINKTLDNLNNIATTIFILHNMDEKAFLNDNIIVPDWDRVEQQKDRFGIDSDVLADIAILWSQALIKSISKTFLEMVRDSLNYTYAAFLKIILIGRTSKKRLLEKMEEFSNFLEQEIKVVLKREVILAMYYFSNKNLLYNFIPIQLNKSFTDVQKHLLRTSWDFFLLRYPEILLPHGCLSYICSAEKAVCKFGRMFTNEIVSMSLPTLISLNFEEIERDLGEEITQALRSQHNIRQQKRQSSHSFNEIEPILKEDLNQLISILESQVSKLCIPN